MFNFLKVLAMGVQTLLGTKATIWSQMSIFWKNLTFLHSLNGLYANNSNTFSHLSLVPRVGSFLTLLLNLLMAKGPLHLHSPATSLLKQGLHLGLLLFCIFWVCLWLFKTLCISYTASG